MSTLVRALLGARARRRWIHLILGGALLMPYWLLGTVALTVAGDVFRSTALQFAAYGLALPMAAVSALFPLTRPLSAAAVRALCGVPEGRLAEGPARTPEARARVSAWWTLHLGLGALISGATLALPPFALSLMVLPFSAGLRNSGLNAFRGPDRTWVLWVAPPSGLLMLLALAACAAAAGALLARVAPLLLGPAPADRLAAAERRAAELAVRNRLARELHDSVGHALSAVTLQASAARKVLDADVEFVREALAAIEETTRRTVAELDSVLGLLRQDENDPDLPAPALDALDGLLARTGLDVSFRTTGDPASVPETVSREAYRIVQEGLSNVLRHCGTSPVTLSIAVTGEELEITMENPLPAAPPCRSHSASTPLRPSAPPSFLDRDPQPPPHLGCAAPPCRSRSASTPLRPSAPPSFLDRDPQPPPHLGCAAPPCRSHSASTPLRPSAPPSFLDRDPQPPLHLGCAAPPCRSHSASTPLRPSAPPSFLDRDPQPPLHLGCAAPPPVRPGGGRGLRGIAERAALLGGKAQAGPKDGVWRLTAVLPLGGAR
ncbi:hypothetical protein GCM10020367_13960 [Streptomyces sannanensis]|uniref:histidine kinase n=1 Tax=Streptomyces sannanensis TaxID=285536 RepID=A0ABP6S779_9ACTN